MSRRILQSLPFVTLALALALTGYWLMFTTFMVYDDEGYVLWSLRSYSEGGGLYTRVFSQYGPFFYAFYDGLHRLFGFAFTNEAGRHLTLAYWLAVAGSGGGLAWMLTRSRTAGMAVAALTFVGLASMVSEPMHPGGLTTLIAMLGAGAGAIALREERPVAFAAVTGLAGAALVLIKINVGVFFLVAAGSWLALSTRPTRGLIWLVALGCVATPLLLMRSLWPAPWVAHFALIFSCGAVAMILPLVRAARAEHRARSWGWFATGGGVLGLVTVGTVIARGTGLEALWNGVVVAPLRHPGVYFFPPPQPTGSGVVALISLGLAVGLKLRPLSLAGTRWLAGLRIAAGVGCFIFMLRAEYEGLARFAVSFGPALAWLMVLPLSGAGNEPLHRARTWLAWVFVWQVLHAYPVAGSQMAWGTFLWGTLLVSGVAEALTVLAPSRRTWQGAGLAAMLAVSLLATSRLALTGRTYFIHSRPLGLPGVESLRPPGDLRQQLIVLNQNLRAHCDSLFSLPGLFSLNIWSDRPTPTGANVTHWFSLLSAAEQQAIIDRLAADPRAGLVVHRYLLDYLRNEGFAAEGPLRTYLDASFVRVLTLGHYELHLHRGRSIAALSTARYVAARPGGTAAIELVIAPTEGQAIAKLALRPLHEPGVTLAETQPTAGSPWLGQTLNPDGTPQGETETLTGPGVPSGITRLTVPVPVDAGWSRMADTCVVALDASGAEIAAALFVP